MNCNARRSTINLSLQPRIGSGRVHALQERRDHRREANECSTCSEGVALVDCGSSAAANTPASSRLCQCTGKRRSRLGGQSSRARVRPSGWGPSSDGTATRSRARAGRTRIDILIFARTRSTRRRMRTRSAAYRVCLFALGLALVVRSQIFLRVIQLIRERLTGFLQTVPAVGGLTGARDSRELVFQLLDDHRGAPGAVLFRAQHVAVDVVADVEHAVVRRFATRAEPALRCSRPRTSCRARACSPACRAAV